MAHPGFACPLCGTLTAALLIRLKDCPALQNRLYESRQEAVSAARYAPEYFYCSRCVFAFDPRFDARPSPPWEAYNNGQLASPRYRAYIEEVVDVLAARAGLGQESLVLEPACGDGYLLSRLAARTGARVLGYDPQYRGRFGMQDAIRKEPFRAPSAERANLVVLRHAIESVTELDAFFEALVASLEPSGLLYVELTDLDALLRRGDATLVSSEYGRYFSLRALDRALERYGLVTSEAGSRFGGDYLAVFARRAPVPGSLETGLDRVESVLTRYHKVVIWGTGGRAISALVQRGWDATKIAFGADSDRGKQGKYIPITGQRILSPAEVREFAPDLVLVSNVQYLKEIRAELPGGTPLLTLDGTMHTPESAAPHFDDSAQFASEAAARITANAQDVALNQAGLRWLKEADRARYEYNFRWLGLPVIQYPEDLVGLQEIIWDVRPDVIVETGIARGGSTIFYASILALLGGDRRVISVDIDIRAHNRARIEGHPLSERITLVSGSSIDDEIVEKVRALCRGRRSVMVCLDSNHTHDHVLAELRAYAPLVGEGSYIVVFDGSIEALEEHARPDRPWARGNSPATAVAAFLCEEDRFIVDEAHTNKLIITSNPRGHLRCLRDAGGRVCP